MMKLHKLAAVFTAILLTGCIKNTGDVLMLPDGSVIEGKLISIGSGEVVFNTATARVPATGRVWLLGGDTFSGDISLADGTVRAGSRQAPADSLLLIVWGDIDVSSGSFIVDASLGWQDTGIELQTGEILALTAEGTVVTETGVATPDGQEKFSSSVALAPGATSGQLVFRIGENGNPVAAGSRWAGESPQSGSLMLAVNVPSSGSIRPGGTYTVHVTAGTNRRQEGATAFYPASR